MDAYIKLLAIFLEILFGTILVYGIIALRSIKINNQQIFDDNVVKDIEERAHQIIIRWNEKIVSKLKSESGDGKLTEAQAQQIYNGVKNAIMETIGNDEVKIMELKYGNIDDALDYIIHSFIPMTKVSPFLNGSTNKDNENTEDKFVFEDRRGEEVESALDASSVNPADTGVLELEDKAYLFAHNDTTE